MQRPWFNSKKLAVGAIGLGLSVGVALWFFRAPTEPGTCVVGDVRDLQAARIPETLRYAQLDAARMQVGVGVAAIEAWEGLGDAVVVAGRAYVRSTRPTTYRTQALESGRFFQTSNMVYVPRGVPPREILSVEAGTTLDNLWQQLGQRFPRGVLVSGTVHWQQLRRYAISRPAIAGISIPEHAPHYYTQPMHNSQDTWTYLVGIAASARTVRDSDGHSKYLFAARPNGELDLPRHVLVLKAAPVNLGEAPKPEDTVVVGRAAGDSQVAGAQLALYPLDNLGACQDAFASGGAPLYEATPSP